MKNRGRHNLAKPLRLAALMVFLIVIPLFLKGYWSYILTLLLINVILVVSFRLITTMGGWSFAHIAIMGVGGYTSALLTTTLLHWSFWLTLPLGGLAAAVFALLISYPCLRTRGFYFFLSTFAAGEAMRQAWIRFDYPFGGMYGISGIIHPNPILGINFVEALPNYYLVLAITLLSMVIMYRLEKSRIGDTVKATAANENLCESIGINTWRYKTLFFVAGSFFAGIAGVLFAHYTGLASPMDFTTIWAFKIVASTIIGGAVTFAGPIIGLVLLTVINELLKDLLWWVPLIYGIIIILVLEFFPGGLETLPRRLPRRVKKIFEDKFKEWKMP